MKDLDGDLVADKKVLVDAKYATDGSVEHRPNGLLIGPDNWIYNARSRKKYRLSNGKWQIAETEFRGQWGKLKIPRTERYSCPCSKAAP